MDDKLPECTNATDVQTPNAQQLRRILEAILADGRKSDAGVAAYIHRAEGFKSESLLVIVNGHRFLSIRHDGKALVVDLESFLLCPEV